jgi:hypothetical protein
MPQKYEAKQSNKTWESRPYSFIEKPAKLNELLNFEQVISVQRFLAIVQDSCFYVVFYLSLYTTYKFNCKREYWIHAHTMKKNGKLRVDWGFEGLLGSERGCRPQVVASPLLAASRVARPQDTDPARNGSLLVTKDGGMANQFRCGILEAGAAWRQDKGIRAYFEPSRLYCSFGWWLMVCADLFWKKHNCWLVAIGWFVLREKYCWLVADKPSERGEGQSRSKMIKKETREYKRREIIRWEVFEYLTFKILNAEEGNIYVWSIQSFVL